MINLGTFYDLIELVDSMYKWGAENDYLDGCKSSEGYIELRVPNYFTRKNGWNGEPKVGVYSYVFGPSRMHDFDSIEEAIRVVQGWWDEAKEDRARPDWDAWGY